MALVKMLKTTNYKGIKLEGTEHVVDNATASRWGSKGIAIAVAEVAQEAESQEAKVDTEPDGDAQPSYEGMTAKQLYQLCLDKDLEVEARKSKEYYLKALTGEEVEAEAGEEAEPTEE